MSPVDRYLPLAKHYDSLMTGLPYKRWAKFIAAFADSACRANIIDLGCGTGNIALSLSQKGFAVTGIDSSLAMLSVARSKPGAECVHWLQQSFTDFTGSADLICCTCDGINHVLKSRILLAMLRQIYQNLRPGGYLIFDVNTPYKFEIQLADNLFHIYTKEAEVIWHNQYKLPWNYANLTIFTRERGLYKRHRICILERCYNLSTLIYYLRQTGFALCGLWDNYSYRSPGPKSKRVTVVSQKT